jgi:hypothetical protein
MTSDRHRQPENDLTMPQERRRASISHRVGHQATQDVPISVTPAWSVTGPDQVIRCRHAVWWV